MNDTTPLDTVNPAPEGEPRARRSARPIVLGIVAGVAAAVVASGGIALASGLADGDDDDRLVITSSPHALTPSPTDDSSPSPSSSPSDDSSATGTTAGSATYDQVTAAALAAVGGGTVLEVDRGDSPGDAAWKVEIRLANGNEAEVRLAADLTVLRVELDNDDSGHGSDDSGSDDHDSSGHGSDD